jgi:hypothetical protein
MFALGRELLNCGYKAGFSIFCTLGLLSFFKVCLCTLLKLKDDVGRVVGTVLLQAGGVFD